MEDDGGDAAAARQRGGRSRVAEAAQEVSEEEEVILFPACVNIFFAAFSLSSKQLCKTRHWRYITGDGLRGNNDRLTWLALRMFHPRPRRSRSCSSETENNYHSSISCTWIHIIKSFTLCVSILSVAKWNWILLPGAARSVHVQSRLCGYCPGYPGERTVPWVRSPEEADDGSSPPQTGSAADQLSSKPRWATEESETKCSRATL